MRQTYLLSDLHDAIQSAFGWHDAHLYQFVDAEGRRALCPHGQDFDMDGDEPSGRAAETKLSKFLSKRGDRCLYEYDFGDGWELDIEVERVANETKDEPWLLDGALSGPPEDCGGVPGYERCADFVRTGADPDDEADSLKDWLGEWTPDSFVPPAKMVNKKSTTKAKSGRTNKALTKTTADDATAVKNVPPENAAGLELDVQKVEEAALAILALTLHDGNRAWKSFDWATMEALHQRGWISKPGTKAKSVALSEEGLRRANEFAHKYFRV